MTGAPAASPPATSTTPPTTDAAPPSGPTPDQRRNRLLLLGAGAIFLLLLIGLVVAFLLLRGDGDEEVWSRLPATVTTSPILWLRADAIRAPGTGGRVATWSSVNNVEAVQNFQEGQPTLVTTGIGSRPAVRFDGVDDVLGVNLNIHPGAHPLLTIVSVFSSDVEASEPLRKLYGSDDGGFDRAAGLDSRSSNGRNYTVFGGPDTGSIGYFNLVANNTYLTVDQFGAGTFNGWVQGVHAVANATTTSGEGTATLYIGGIYPYDSAFGQEPWQGELAEMMIFPGTLPDTQRTALEDFLARKYDIDLLRPSSE
jgi:hypothetical protein